MPRRAVWAGEGDVVGSEAGLGLRSGESSGKCAASRVGSESRNLPPLPTPHPCSPCLWPPPSRTLQT